MSLNVKEVNIIELGSIYNLPRYKVEDGIGLVLDEGYLQITFVRGSKIGTENIEKRTGTLQEALIRMLIIDLEFKNTLVPSEEGNKIIEHLKAIEKLQEDRAEKRKAANVQGTYKTIAK